MTPARKVMRAALLLSLWAGGGCGSGSSSGTVRGLAVDTQRQPLAGATITVCPTVFTASCITATTQANGSYAVTLPSANQWSATGSIVRSYNGATYCLPLAIDNTNSFSSTDASVRNFTWELSGVIAGQIADTYASSYFGASLNVVYSSNVNFDLTLVRVDFVPSGPLVDGSAGTAFSATVGSWASSYIGDIPLGRYVVSAVYTGTGGPTQLGVSTASSTGPLFNAVTVDFPPDPGGSCTLEPSATLYVVGP